MRAEKKIITSEYLQRLSSSPFFIVVDYRGLTVGHFTELRKRLHKAGAEIHVVKNSIFRIAAEEAGITGLNGAMAGQLAVVTGQRDISATAKILKSFQAEFDKPKVKFGFLDNGRLELEQLTALADLPPLEVLRAHLLGTLQAPAARLARLLSTPGTQLARVLKAKADKQGEGAA